MVAGRQQPQHPGGPAWLPINLFTAFLPFPAAKLLAHIRETTCCICLRRAQIRSPCHPGALVTGGVGRLLTALLFVLLHQQEWTSMPSVFPRAGFCCAFNPLSPSSSPSSALSARRAPLLPGCLPSLSPPLAQSEARKLVKSSASVPS